MKEMTMPRDDENEIKEYSRGFHGMMVRLGWVRLGWGKGGVKVVLGWDNDSVFLNQLDK